MLFYHLLPKSYHLVKWLGRVAVEQEKMDSILALGPPFEFCVILQQNVC